MVVWEDRGVLKPPCPPRQPSKPPTVHATGKQGVERMTLTSGNVHSIQFIYLLAISSVTFLCEVWTVYQKVTRTAKLHNFVQAQYSPCLRVLSSNSLSPWLEMTLRSLKKVLSLSLPLEFPQYISTKITMFTCKLHNLFAGGTPRWRLKTWRQNHTHWNGSIQCYPKTPGWRMRKQSIPGPSSEEVRTSIKLILQIAQFSAVVSGWCPVSWLAPAESSALPVRTELRSHPVTVANLHKKIKQIVYMRINSMQACRSKTTMYMHQWNREMVYFSPNSSPHKCSTTLESVESTEKKLCSEELHACAAELKSAWNSPRIFLMWMLSSPFEWFSSLSVAHAMHNFGKE